MVSASVQLTADTRLASKPLSVKPGDALGQVKISTPGGEADVTIYGVPQRMRELAVEIERAAGQAEHLLRIEGLLADAGRLERTEA